MTRIESEKQTARAMIHLFCHSHHGTQKGTLCSACQSLFEFVEDQLEHCPMGEKKPACKNCSVHCYPPGRRAQIIGVMRFSGPRLMYKHPVMTVRHFLVARKKR